jgi:hypothetical protein
MREIGTSGTADADLPRCAARGITLIQLSEAHLDRIAPHERNRSVRRRFVSLAPHDSSFIGDFRRPCFMSEPYENPGAPCGRL